MAIPSYDQSLDTMVSTALDTYSKDPINALTDSGEKLLKAAATNGRVFIVNDAENVRHPILYGHGEGTSLYTPDVLTGTPDGTNYLSETAKEVLTQALFSISAGTRNINFPQSQPAGNLIDYVSAVVKANMMHMFNSEEILFVQGRPAGSTGEQIMHAPFSTDDGFVAGYPMSLASITQLSSAPTSQGGTDEDGTDLSFANVKVDDVAKWQPHHENATSTNHSTLIADLQSAILGSSYSEIERPTHVYMALGSFQKMLALLRAEAALPDPVNANLGKEGTIAFGGVTLDWSRYLDKDVVFDTDATSDTTATYPILGVNWNSLRLNTTRAGSVASDIGFIRQLGGLQPHPTKTNLFKRIEYKRCWSVDNGRRSFFTIAGTSGYTTIA